MLLAIVRLCIEDYTIALWHQWLCYVAIIWLAVAINTFGMHMLPAFNEFIRESEPAQLPGPTSYYTQTFLQCTFRWEHSS